MLRLKNEVCKLGAGLPEHEPLACASLERRANGNTPISFKGVEVCAKTITAIGEEYKKFANERIWIPATIDANGRISNVTQAYVTPKGAKPGESNYLTQKKPTKHGKFETELGTFTANKHKLVQILKTDEIDIDAQMLKLGRVVKRRYVDDFARAVAMAAEIVADQNNSDESALYTKQNPRTEAA